MSFSFAHLLNGGSADDLVLAEHVHGDVLLLHEIEQLVVYDWHVHPSLRPELYHIESTKDSVQNGQNYALKVVSSHN